MRRPLVASVVAIAAVGVAYVLADEPSTAATSLGPVQWGSVAEWIAGIGTVGALWFVFLRMARDSENRLREQARHVSAWSTGFRLPDERWNIPMTGINFKVRNGSEEPIYRCWVAIHSPDGRGDLMIQGQLFDVIPPESVLDGMGSVDVEGDVQEFFVRGLFRIEVHFTDARGNHWMRASDGVIHRKSQGVTE